MKPCISITTTTSAAMVVLVATMLMDVAGAGMLRSSSKHRQLVGFNCSGDFACRPNNGSIGAKSCAGESSCRYNQGSIGANSCRGMNSCFENKGKIGDGSCLSDQSCKWITDVTIGDDACVGEYACSGSSGGTMIGNGACKGENACKDNVNTRIDDGCCVEGKNYNAFYCTWQSNERISCDDENSFKWTPPTESPSNIAGGSLEPFPN